MRTNIEGMHDSEDVRRWLSWSSAREMVLYASMRANKLMKLHKLLIFTAHKSLFTFSIEILLLIDRYEYLKSARSSVGVLRVTWREKNIIEWNDDPIKFIMHVYDNFISAQEYWIDKSWRIAGQQTNVLNPNGSHGLFGFLLRNNYAVQFNEWVIGIRSDLFNK